MPRLSQYRTTNWTEITLDFDRCFSVTFRKYAYTAAENRPLVCEVGVSGAAYGREVGGVNCDRGGKELDEQIFFSKLSR